MGQAATLYISPRKEIFNNKSRTCNVRKTNKNLVARVQIPAKFLALSSLQLIPQACDRYFNETQRPANWVCRQQNSHSHVRSENQKE